MYLFIIRDTFDIDSSVGRELIFQLDVSREKSTDACQKDIEIKFLIPGQGSEKTELFRCDKSNFGVYKIDLTSYNPNIPAPEGRWMYLITKHADENVSISVKITAKSKVNF